LRGTAPSLFVQELRPVEALWAKGIVLKNNKIIVIIQNIMKDEDRINEIIGIIFFPFV